MYSHVDIPRPGARGRAGLRHEALFHAGAEQLLAGVLPYVEEGLEAGEAILVAVAAPVRRGLEAALDGGERIEFAAIEELGRNPARMIPFWCAFLEAGLDDGVGVRGVGQGVWPGRSEAEVDECDRHEALLNRAFATAPAWSLLCLYDTDALDDATLDAAARSHPILREGGMLAASGPYRADGDVFAGELEPPPPLFEQLPFGADDLSRVRRLVGEHAELAGLAGRRAEDFVLAANEIATNSVRHGGGSGVLRIWREGGELVCEVRDSGRFVQALVGRERPAAAQFGGRGLWTANQLCDLVQIRNGEGGSVVRLRVGLS